MENASKALLIAAAILIAIIIITIGIKIYTSTSETGKVADSTRKTISEKTEDAVDSLELSGWKIVTDGSFSKGKMTGVHVGDIVRYENVISDVKLTQNSKIIKDLRDYSGNTDSNFNTSDTVLQDKTMSWRVLDIKDGKLRLISNNPTDIQIKLAGYNGYNNGVYLLDEICNQLYSSKKGKAQNLKIEDIEKYLTYNYTQSINDNTGTAYGLTKEFTSNLYYPNIYDKEKNGLGKSQQNTIIEGTSIATDKLKATQTYWRKKMISSDFTDQKYFNIFMNVSKNYWLSSRTIYFADDYVGFFVREIYNGGWEKYVSNTDMYYSDGSGSYGRSVEFKTGSNTKF